MIDNSISLLYSQPITALQILTNGDEWRWVKHVQGAGKLYSRPVLILVVVNTADALQFLTGGLFKATRHRVMRPPNDQSDIIRYILIHFARVRRDLPLNPIWDSPLVAKLGKNAFQDRIDAGGQAPTQDEWLRERIKRTGNELCEPLDRAALTVDDSNAKQKNGKVVEDIMGHKVEYYV